MSEDRDSVLQRFTDMRHDLLAAIDGLTPEQLSERTLDGWSVKDHLFHLAGWDAARAAEVERISAGHDSALRMNGEQDAAFSKLIHELCADLGVEQALWELTATHQRLLRAFVEATPRGLDAGLYGEAGILSNHEATHVGWIRRWRGERGY